MTGRPMTRFGKFTQCSLLPFVCLFALSSCGGAAAEEMTRTAVTNSAKRAFLRPLNFEAPPLDEFAYWAYWAANVGGFLIILSVIFMIWLSDKKIAMRTFANGILFGMVAKAIEILGANMGWLLLLSIPIGIIMNLPTVEGLLAKMGWRIDLNRDGKIDDETIRKVKEIETEVEIEPTPADWFEDTDTDIIENGDSE